MAFVDEDRSSAPEEVTVELDPPPDVLVNGRLELFCKLVAARVFGRREREAIFERGKEDKPLSDVVKEEEEDCCCCC